MKLSTARTIIKLKGALFTAFIAVIVPIIIKKLFKNTDSTVITGLVQAAVNTT